MSDDATIDRLIEQFVEVLGMEAALAELMELDGTKTLAIKRSLLAEVQRRRRREAMLGLITAWEDEQGPIDQKHLDWADRVLDRQGVDG